MARTKGTFADTLLDMDARSLKALAALMVDEVLKWERISARVEGNVYDSQSKLDSIKSELAYRRSPNPPTPIKDKNRRRTK